VENTVYSDTELRHAVYPNYSSKVKTKLNLAVGKDFKIYKVFRR
jgi:hypothetical protein